MGGYPRGLVCLGRGAMGESGDKRARSGAVQRSATREARSFEGRRVLPPLFGAKQVVAVSSAWPGAPFYSDSRVVGSRAGAVTVGNGE